MSELNKTTFNYKKNGLGIFTFPTSEFPVQVSGSIGPSIASYFDLGSSQTPWRNIYGTASNATSASWAPAPPPLVSGSTYPITASFAVSASNALSASMAVSASWAPSNDLSAYLSSSWTGSNLSQFSGTSSFAVSASEARLAETAVLATNATNVGINTSAASVPLNVVFVSASTGYAGLQVGSSPTLFTYNPTTAVLFVGAISASSVTASVFGSASYATSASYALSASNAFSASYAFSGSYTLSASYGFSASYTYSGSWADTSGTASFLTRNRTYEITASQATSASYATPYLDDLIDVTLTSPAPSEVLKWNGVEWVNATEGGGAAGSVSYYLSNVSASGGNESLSITPDPGPQDSHSVVTNNNIRFIQRFVSPVIVGNLQAGLWTIHSYAALTAGTTVGLTQMHTRINRAHEITGSVTITGAGAQRTASFTGVAPLVASDTGSTANILSATLIATPSQSFWISTVITPSSSIVTATTGSYVNESNVTASLYYLLFRTTTGDINATTPTSIEVLTYQPEFAMQTGDRFVAAYFAQTDQSANKTVALYHGGTSSYSHIETPLTTRHNDLVGLQGGASSEYYHLTQAEYTGTGTGIFVRQSGASITGSLQGSSSYALSSSYSLSASYAVSASWAPGISTGSTYPITASYAVSASYAVTTSYSSITIIQSLNTTQSMISTQSLFAGSASFASSSLTSSFVQNETNGADYLYNATWGSRLKIDYTAERWHFDGLPVSASAFWGGTFTGSVFSGGTFSGLVTSSQMEVGNVRPILDNTYTLGTPSLTWANVYATSITASAVKTTSSFAISASRAVTAATAAFASTANSATSAGILANNGTLGSLNYGYMKIGAAAISITTSSWASVVFGTAFDGGCCHAKVIIFGTWNGSNDSVGYMGEFLMQKAPVGVPPQPGIIIREVNNNSANKRIISRIVDPGAGPSGNLSLEFAASGSAATNFTGDVKYEIWFWDGQLP